jgi:hypothetical protein
MPKAWNSESQKSNGISWDEVSADHGYPTRIIPFSADQVRHELRSATRATAPPYPGRLGESQAARRY